MSDKTSMKWRVGLLITTVTMGIILVVSGINEYRAAKRNAKSVTQAQIMSMIMGLRRELRQGPPSPDEFVTDFFAELQSHGVTYVAVADRKRTIAYAAGSLKVPFTLDLEPLTKPNQGNLPVTVELYRNGHIAHALIKAPFPRTTPGGSGKHARKKGHFPQFGVQKPGARKQPKGLLLIEMVPKEAIAIVDRAFTVMIIDVVAASLLIGAAIVFWRLSRRAEHFADEMTRQQQKMTRQLERDRQLKMLGQMSAVLGHELKNPIAALKGHAQLLEEKMPADSPEKNQIQIIVKETNHLETLTNHVLDFAKTGALHLEKVYLDDLAYAAATFSKAEPIEISVTPNNATWQLDRHKMEQVLVNVLVNARQAEAQTPIELTFAQRPSQLIITVGDRGKGIDMSLQEKLFEPFFTNRAQGTGLGLSLVKRIVEEHGGTVAIQNRHGGGALLTITLPNMDTDKTGNKYVETNTGSR